MLSTRQIALLGLIVLQGSDIIAMDTGTGTNVSQNLLSCSTEARMNDADSVIFLKRSVELRKEKKNYKIRDCGTRFIANPYFAEILKNDRRIGWLPV